MPRRRSRAGGEAAQVQPILRPLAERVRSLREERNLTQELLADSASLNYKYLGRIEGARANPSAMILMRLAQALGVHVGELFSTTPAGGAPGRVADDEPRASPARKPVTASRRRPRRAPHRASR